MSMNKRFFIQTVYLTLFIFLPGLSINSFSQVTFPENGVADPRHGHYAFTNARIIKDANTTISNATLVNQGRKNNCCRK